MRRAFYIVQFFIITMISRSATADGEPAALELLEVSHSGIMGDAGFLRFRMNLSQYDQDSFIELVRGGKPLFNVITTHTASKAFVRTPIVSELSDSRRGAFLFVEIPRVQVLDLSSEFGRQRHSAMFWTPTVYATNPSKCEVYLEFQITDSECYRSNTIEFQVESQLTNSQQRLLKQLKKAIQISGSENLGIYESVFYATRKSKTARRIGSLGDEFPETSCIRFVCNSSFLASQYMLGIPIDKELLQIKCSYLTHLGKNRDHVMSCFLNGANALQIDLHCSAHTFFYEMFELTGQY